MQTKHIYENYDPYHTNFVKYKDQYKIITIIFGTSPDPVKENFRCNNCGKLLFQHFNKLVTVIYAEVVEQSMYTEYKCASCKVAYRHIKI